LSTPDPDGIYPGQTWTARYQTASSVRVTVVDGPRIGFTPKDSDTVKYLTRRKFAAAYRRVQPAA
jgi:hypothetical protein